MSLCLPLIAVVLAVGLAASSCKRGNQQEATAARSGPSAAERLGPIDVADGIDAAEAAIIAAVYFEGHIAEFGWTGPPAKQRPETWQVPVFQGVKGRLLPDAIAIDARTGAVSFPGRRAFSSLAELKASVEKAR